MKKNILTIIALAAVPCAHAVQIAPTGYSIDQTPDNGTYIYQDNAAGNKLTDGTFGGFPVNSQAAANSWLGFKDPLVNIDFEFDEVVSFNEIKVDTLQVGLGNIVLPSIFVYSSTDGSDWTLLNSIDNSPPSGTNNGYQLLPIPVTVDSQLLRVSLAFAENGPWTFVSEIQFFGDRRTPGQNVPEGGATVALLGLSMLGLGLIKRKRN